MAKIASIRKKFITIQLLVFIFASTLMYILDLQGSREFLLLYSLWNIASYSYLLIEEVKYSPKFHIYILLAFICAWYIGVNGVYSYQTLEREDDIFFGIYSVKHCIAKGILFMSLEHLILFGVFFYFENKYKRKDIDIYSCIMSSNIDYAKWARNNYFLIWILRLLSYKINLASITGVMVQYAAIGYLITLFCLLFAYIKNRNSSILKWHWIIVAIEISLVLNHGMKEEIIRAVIPYVIYLLIMYKAGRQSLNFSTIIKLSLLGLFVIGFVFPYIRIFRDLSIKQGKEWSEIKTSEAIDAYTNYITSSKNNSEEDKNNGLDYAMSRAGSLGNNAWSIDYSETNGPTPQFFTYFMIGPIPRIIWHDKPSMVTGGMAYRLITGNSDWMNQSEAAAAGCSITLGFIGSCVFCFGLYGGLVLLFMLSISIWYVWHSIESKIYNNIIALWIFISLISSVYKDFEDFQDCGVNFFFTNLILIFIMNAFFTKR